MKRAKIASGALTLGALGIVFGDIGASPLYALDTLFRFGQIPLTKANLYGIASMIIWAMIVIVSAKYIWLVTRADNNGEGGILALSALLKGKLKAKPAVIMISVALVGLAFFYADSMITPALSVLSALSGIQVIAPELSSYIIPAAIVVLIGVFVAQSRGSNSLGKWFGPILLVWFAASAIAGLVRVIAHPSVLITLSPLTAFDFIWQHPLYGFFALTAVTLAITGTEALYADMGQFGRRAIRRAWFCFVFPALVLTYMGQAAIVASDPAAAHSAYFALFPSFLQLPMTILATIVTVMAAQAVISGVFSLTRQAVRLGYIPPLLIKHTSSEEVGQVYVGSINWLMCGVVILLVLLFGNGTYLAAALSLAVSMTWLIDGLLFAVVAVIILKWRWWRAGLFLIVFTVIDVALVVAGVGKIWYGAWIPIAIAAAALYIIASWIHGRRIISRERQSVERELGDFVRSIRHRSKPLPRPHGSAVYIAHHEDTTPMALQATVDHLHELMSTVVIVTVKTLDIPHVAVNERATIDDLGFTDDGISHVALTFGFNDVPNVPRALEYIRGSTPELNFSKTQTTYFVSDTDIAIIRGHRMPQLQKLLFVWMRRNATKDTAYYHLPTDRTIDMASYVEL